MPNNPKGRGVLPVNAAATKKPFKQTPRAPAPRLRLIVRRLPPGLTESEFWTCLGKEWQLGQGKIDWAAYKPGKLSKDLAKPSRPSRAYLKVKDLSHLDLLSAHIKAVNFQDAKNSFRDPCLIGMPSLEFAPYNKIPSGRARHDGRQGTIDQDPEFIDFLHSLTEPITKSAANGDAEAKQEKVTTTPLVQYIKDKKANKAKEKEVAAAKAGKKADGKDAKSATPSKSEQQLVVKKGTTSEAEKARVAKATQDVVKAIHTLSKSAASQQSKTTQAKPETPVKEPTTPTTSQPTPKRERQRGDANAAARIISRDLGLTPKEGRSTKGSKATSSPTTTPSAPASTPATPPTPKGPVAPAASTPQPSPQPPTGPRNLRNSTPQPSPLRPPPASSAQQPTPKPNNKPSPQPSSGAKSAFLKHANPSQGITEDLLRTTFSVYGALTRCEIDKKKGLGYLDFAEPEGLKKAMAASPVKIANGSVVVLENRSPYRKASQPSAQAKGSAAASTSTSVASSPKVSQATLTSIAETAAIPPKITEPAAVDSQVSSATALAPVETVPAVSEAGDIPSTPVSPTATTTPGQTQTPPSAPRANGGGRGGRGHYRGRGGFRGRGGYRGGNKAANNASGNGSSAPSTPTTSAAESKG